MNFTKLSISGLWVIEPKVFADSRGYFMESWKKDEFEQTVGKVNFIQDNESKSSFGVFRGLHYQEGATAQAKLVHVIVGRVWDIAVDIRDGSPTFGQYEAMELSEDNHLQFFIPCGFAHGFLVLSDTAVFSYKVDNIYSPSTEHTINCFDPDIAIQFPVDRAVMKLSPKDEKGLSLRDIQRGKTI
ncbi:MAG: dTDP-4-dehydrorhamnose 3,5-epimerase [Dysgonamonadaceae bacterium]|jgi:dTDP-4-dehydrorhamnose 3,5-epimerase|nr:dTDP-4-dehydrorhamnose 3,5-epimerase [Dysgonamonadaceae bacterium]